MNKVYLVKETFDKKDVVLAIFSDEEKANTYVEESKLLGNLEQWIEPWMVDACL